MSKLTLELVLAFVRVVLSLLLGAVTLVSFSPTYPVGSIFVALAVVGVFNLFISVLGIILSP